MSRKLAEFQGAIRRVGRRFDDDRIAGNESWADFATEQVSRLISVSIILNDGRKPKAAYKVPGHNAATNAQRCIPLNHLPFLAFFQNFFWQLHITKYSNAVNRCVEFAIALRKRLALLERQKPREVFLVLCYCVCESEQGFPPLCNWRSGPSFEGFACAGYC